MVKIGRRLRPSPAMAVAFIALFIALAGTAYSVSSQVPGKGGVKASDIAKGAVKKGKIAGQAVAAGKIANGAVETGKIANGAVETAKIADKAVTSGKFFLSGTTTVTFGNVGGEACASINIPAAGVTANDHVLVTPPPVWPDTFSITAVAENGNIRVAGCNTFTGGGSVDPDGTGGIKFLVIR
jgi:hypothetical protein